MRWQTWRTMTDKYCPTCTGAQYADDIYDAKRSNFWEYTCPFRFATGSATFGASCGNGSIQSNTSGCCGSAAQSAADSIGALRYREPLSFAAYQQRVRATDVLEQNRAASGAVLNATADAPRIGDTACIGCRDCSIEPSCGAAEFGSGCGPRPLPERRMRHNAVPFKPASSFPLHSSIWNHVTAYKEHLLMPPCLVTMMTLVLTSSFFALCNWSLEFQPRSLIRLKGAQRSPLL